MPNSVDRLRHVRRHPVIGLAIAFAIGVAVTAFVAASRPPRDRVGVAQLLDFQPSSLLCAARPSDCDNLRKRADVQKWDSEDKAVQRYFAILFNALTPMPKEPFKEPFCFAASIYNGEPAAGATAVPLAPPASPTPSKKPAVQKKAPVRPGTAPGKSKPPAAKKPPATKSSPTPKPTVSKKPAASPKPKPKSTPKPTPAGASSAAPATRAEDIPIQQLGAIPLPSESPQAVARDATVTVHPAVHDALLRLDALAVAAMNSSLAQVGGPGSPSAQRLIKGTQCYRKRLHQLERLENEWFHGRLTCRPQWVVDSCTAALTEAQR